MVSYRKLPTKIIEITEEPKNRLPKKNGWKYECVVKKSVYAMEERNFINSNALGP